MKSLYNFIIESTKSQKNFWAEQFINSLKGSKVNKDSVIKMFDNLDMDIIKSLSDYLYETDLKDYIAYQPSNDEFLNKENKDIIVNKIAEYLIKKITQ